MQTSLTQVLFTSLAIAASIPVTAFLIRSFYAQYIRNPGEPPLISGIIPFVGCGIEYSKDPWKFLTAARKRYGSVVTLFMGGLRITFILDAKLYDKIYRTSKTTLNFDEFVEKVNVRLFQVVYPPEVNPGFHRSHALMRGTYVTTMSKVFKDLLDKEIPVMLEEINGTIDENGYKTVGMYEFCRKTFFFASVKMIFGPKFSSSLLYEHFDTYDEGIPLFFGGLPDFILGKHRKSHNVLIKMVQDALAESAPTDLSEVVWNRSEVMKEFNMSDESIAKSHFAFMWGSQANTIPAAYWTLMHIVSSADVLERVKRELSKLDDDSIPVPEDLPYLNACISESLRLYSQVFSARQVIDSYSITTDTTTYVMRKGDLLNLPVPVPHLDTKLYTPENPADEFCMNFNPDRFLVDPEKKQPWSFIPFGGGSFMCPGRHIARSEILVFVWRMLEKLDLQCEFDVPNPKISSFGFGVAAPEVEVNITCKLR
ncbi:Cytochrome P450 7B1 [Nowakowskiella sp. JEL0407]|nr:Cytochrome P450 7B1 [Nowakowskiella sp. JEL0407]